jgi:hypothetical protein
MNPVNTVVDRVQLKEGVGICQTRKMRKRRVLYVGSVLSAETSREDQGPKQP